MGNMREEEVEIFGPTDQMRIVVRKMWEDRKKAKLDFWFFNFAVSKSVGKGLLKYRVEDCWVPDVVEYLKETPGLQATVDGHDIDNHGSYKYAVREGKIVYPDTYREICRDVQKLFKKMHIVEGIKNNPELENEVQSILQRISWVQNPPKFELGEDEETEFDPDEHIFGDLADPMDN